MSREHPVPVTLENRLMSNGIYVTDVTWDEDGDPDESRPPDGIGLSLEYETVAEGAAVTTDEVSAVVRTLLSIAEEREWTPGRLEVTSRTTDGELRGRWHVERAWFEGVGTGLTEIEFSRRVLNTRSNRSNEN
ncbi:hypothetical protein ACFO5R_08580 [Halosolutus amylolyticus]|uniref:DUF8159 domain-containing protein n=1 Tax=Halosolutus amylolyticus TaxID=2932267 RepID=A0ABD5PMZ5_9EURY|nr:hypothetical protein [Halosolutus amylolyticus]